MWCSSCRQDVPAIAASSGGRQFRCARCGQLLAGTGSRVGSLGQLCAVGVSDHGIDLAEPSFARQSHQRPSMHEGDLALDDWALDARLDGVDDLLDSIAPPILFGRDGGAGRYFRFDVPEAKSYEALAGDAMLDLAAHDSGHARPARRKRRRLVGFVSWMAISTGIALLACGAVLIGWAFIEDRDLLWHLGIPLAIAGQAALLMGVVLKLDRRELA